MHDSLSTLPALPHIPDEALPLWGDPERQICWLGLFQESAFRCNSYVILDQDMGILVDPGNRESFPTILRQLESVLDPAQLSGLVLCHQDPDVAASLPLWLERNPDLTIITSPRTRVLLPHYGIGRYAFHDIEAEPLLALPSGAELRFIPAPFLHSPMAFTTHHSASGALFSGDIFAAIDTEWRLVVTDFDDHAAKMDMFHVDYMASNVASRGFVRRLRELGVENLRMILPQHGSLIPRRFIPQALGYLEELQCGTDLLYPDMV